MKLCIARRIPRSRRRGTLEGFEGKKDTARLNKELMEIMEKRREIIKGKLKALIWMQNVVVVESTLNIT
jgi:hypothetical protein